MKITEEFLLENEFAKKKAGNRAYYSRDTFCVFYNDTVWAPCRIENNDIVVVGDNPYHFLDQEHLIKEYEMALNRPFYTPPRQ